MTTFDPATVDVMANDTLQEGETGTVLLQVWGNDDYEYVEQAERSEGNWTVVDNQVVFTPSSDWNGGWVNIEYQLSDTSGHTATTSISIEYPYVIQAEYDYKSTGSVSDPVTVDVLENDTLLDDATPNVLLYDGSNYSTDVEIIGEGNWTVNNNQVTFTPSTDFTGGSVYIDYQLTDGLGHSDTAGINIDLI